MIRRILVARKMENAFPLFPESPRKGTSNPRRFRRRCYFEESSVGARTDERMAVLQSFRPRKTRGLKRTIGVSPHGRGRSEGTGNGVA